MGEAASNGMISATSIVKDVQTQHPNHYISDETDDLYIESFSPTGLSSSQIPHLAYVIFRNMQETWQNSKGLGFEIETGTWSYESPKYGLC